RIDYRGYHNNGSSSSSFSSEFIPFLRHSTSFDHLKLTNSCSTPLKPEHADFAIPLAILVPRLVLLPHWNLDIWIYDAKNLRNMDKFHKIVGDVFGIFPGNGNNNNNNVEERIIHNPKITSDPYVSISIVGVVIGRTFVLSNDENPVWMQHFNVPVAHYAVGLKFTVKDSDVVGSQLIGIVTIPVEKLYYEIKQCKDGVALSLSVEYIPMENLDMYHHGVGSGPGYIGVPGTYIPLRKGGLVTLYQDAHVSDRILPSPCLDSGEPYVHGKCWQDTFWAMQEARRLIYITRWSVWNRLDWLGMVARHRIVLWESFLDQIQGMELGFFCLYGMILLQEASWGIKL
ncbi:LOW QUALITY PROTEIN: hypothetical protein V2J09_017700, partial [Rumex salicifolius]